jgi:hypothetical protein
MYNVLFYGNCQPEAVLSALNLPNEKYQTKYIACFSNNITEYEFLQCIVDSDIIITQPIKDNYLEKFYLSTSFIIQNAKSTTKIIIFDSCHFEFYYFDLTYKKIDNEILHQPIDYHYNSMVECFKNNRNPDEYIKDYVYNRNLKSSEELEMMANKSLIELNERYNKTKEKYEAISINNICVITTHDYVKSNYKEKLLFYSMNHPTKYVIEYICEEIIKYLDIPNTINYNLDGVNNAKCILYQCIQSNVNFDISKHTPNTCGLTDLYSITNLYYSAYRHLDITKL